MRSHRRSTQHSARFARALLLGALLGIAVCPPLFSAEIDQQRLEANRAYQVQLAELATSFAQRGWLEEAAWIRAWHRPSIPREIQIHELPSAVGVWMPAWKPDWQGEAEFRRIRVAQADRLFALARQALEAQRYALAMELTSQSAREHPDHAAARRVLGYQLHEGRWHTPYTIAKLKAGRVWDDRYGWIAATHLPRYEAGERYYRGRWISADEDARQHAAIELGWDVETEHFVVTTNHSLEAAARLGSRLEQLYLAWRMLFPSYAASGADLQKLFDDKPVASTPRKRYQVVFFRDQAEYQAALRGEIPEKVQTTGIYLGNRRTAYFFASDKPDDGTLYHEAVHQLFSESRAVVPEIGLKANFWIVEGIACYFESLARYEGYHALGGIAAVRLQDARYRRLKDNFHVPLAELTRLGRPQLQRDERIARLYSESAGLTDFLIHAHGGQYRPALTAYLLAVYTGRDQPGTLVQLSGKSYEQLDAEYAEFLQLGDRPFANWSKPGKLDYLLLAGTRVNDADLADLPPLEHVKLLDLASTPVSDAGLAHLHSLKSLQSLDLSGTQCTAAGIASLRAALPGLTIKQ